MAAGLQVDGGVQDAGEARLLDGEVQGPVQGAVQVRLEEEVALLVATLHLTAHQEEVVAVDRGGEVCGVEVAACVVHVVGEGHDLAGVHRAVPVHVAVHEGVEGDGGGGGGGGGSAKAEDRGGQDVNRMCDVGQLGGQGGLGLVHVTDVSAALLQLLLLALLLQLQDGGDVIERTVDSASSVGGGCGLLGGVELLQRNVRGVQALCQLLQLSAEVGIVLQQLGLLL